MMVGSKISSNQRPDTLMQDRIRQIDETSCTARPDHTLGSFAPVRVGPLSGHFGHEFLRQGRDGPILLQNSLKILSRSDSVMLMRIGGACNDGAE
jgi:hypothetical protein